MNIKEPPAIDIEKICEMFNYPSPKNDGDFADFFIFNEFTSIPYLVLSSKFNENKAKGKYFENEMIKLKQSFFNRVPFGKHYF